MPRYKLLSTIDVTLVAPAPAPEVPAPAKLDVAPEFSGVDADGRFSFTVPAYDTGTHNVLEALHVSLFEKPVDGTAAAVPTDPAEIVKAAMHFSTGAAKAQLEVAPPTIQAETVVVDATAAPEGSYAAALVAEFDA